ncbi:hypothetical protein BAUCODRAFT_119116 [Baudoinia panamericana UAMH 10762]|uniref:Uncharacterized protein n=1 Tax=Baudoinia panamericana (strain UAMH 10762) TaxID=717646 RepID=M2MRT9_BAUPA|nr:uncharacterized protein BAUCODRAFT_119116 [Baudoinia panamericana UAMH 10762]EMC99536.1 hypothetical protein BAUCODRAFT_119116 [Baudoinia panamericana UAMH 10762]
MSPDHKKAKPQGETVTGAYPTVQRSPHTTPVGGVGDLGGCGRLKTGWNHNIL